MKRIYSVILLVSFLIGALQPILPMVQYQLHEGDIVELFVDGISNMNSSCDLNDCKLVNCKTQLPDEEQNLLDIDYYPLALQITTIPKPIVFFNKAVLYLFTNSSVESPPILPVPPPPRFG